MKKLIILLIFASVSFAQSCETTLIDLKIKKSGVRLSSIVEGIADKCAYSIFYENGGEDIKKRLVNIVDINKKTPIEILDFLFSRYNYNYEIKDDVIIISKYSTRTFKIDYIDTQRKSASKTKVSVSSSSDSSSASSGDTGANIDSTEVFDFWTSIENDVKSLILRPEDGPAKDPKIVINRKGGFLTVTGTRKQLDRVSAYIKDLLKRLNKQVLISVNILAVELDNSYRTGIDWSKLRIGFNMAAADTKTHLKGDAPSQIDSYLPQSGLSTLVLPKSNQWTAAQSYAEAQSVLNFMRSFGETKSLSNPKLVSMNGQPSLISVGSNINYLVRNASTSDSGTSTTNNSVKDLFIGILLDITPQIDDGGYITLKINPSVTDYKYPNEDDKKQSVARELPPDTISRRVSTVVRVKSGETIILGGLITTNKSLKDNKVALLGDIPFLGRLFKSSDITDRTQELVFILTPMIIENTKNVNLKDFGYELTDLNMTK
ncbi:MAG: pilus (MSHA type) biogenesis protein MshL [Helicobacteraceae bacterium]